MKSLGWRSEGARAWIPAGSGHAWRPATVGDIWCVWLWDVTDRELNALETEQFWVQTATIWANVSTDGEVRMIDSPPHYRIRPHALSVVVPRRAMGAAFGWIQKLRDLLGVELRPYGRLWSHPLVLLR